MKCVAEPLDENANCIGDTTECPSPPATVGRLSTIRARVSTHRRCAEATRISVDGTILVPTGGWLRLMLHGSDRTRLGHGEPTCAAGGRRSSSGGGERRDHDGHDLDAAHRLHGRPSRLAGRRHGEPAADDAHRQSGRWSHRRPGGSVGPRGGRTARRRWGRGSRRGRRGTVARHVAVPALAEQRPGVRVTTCRRSGPMVCPARRMPARGCARRLAAEAVPRATSTASGPQRASASELHEGLDIQAADGSRVYQCSPGPRTVTGVGTVDERVQVGNVSVLACPPSGVRRPVRDALRDGRRHHHQERAATCTSRRYRAAAT